MPPRDLRWDGEPHTAGRVWQSAWAGAGLLLLGLITVGTVVYLGDTTAEPAERIYFALGLPGLAFMSLAGQVMGTIGLVILWRCWRRAAARPTRSATVS